MALLEDRKCIPINMTCAMPLTNANSIAFCVRKKCGLLCHKSQSFTASLSPYASHKLPENDIYFYSEKKIIVCVDIKAAELLLFIAYLI